MPDEIGIPVASRRSLRQSINLKIGKSADWRRLLAALTLAFSACSATQPGGFTQSFTRSHVSHPGMPCSEAGRVARAALLRVGFAGELVSAPQPGVPGTLVGKKAGGFDAVTNQASREYTATVTISCSNAGAEFYAVTDEPLPGSLTFMSDFASAVRTVAGRRIKRPRLADRPATGLVVSVEPLRGSEASGEFDADLPAAGVTPVRVQIDNRTERTYTFAAKRVRLVTQEGERVKPLSADAAVSSLGSAAQATVRAKHIGDATIAPRATLSGFLYFPASAYRRATLVLIDTESEEEEGVSVEF